MINGIGTNPHAAHHFGAIREKLFKRADSNGDGQLSKDEVSAALPPGRKGNVDTLFTRLDTNQDGFISEAENAAPANRTSHRGAPQNADPAQLAQQIFEKADTDKDGKITATELEQIFKGDHSSDQINNFLKAIDSDGDGAVSQPELEGFLKQLFTAFQASGATQDSSASYDNTGFPQATDAPASTFTQTA